MSTAKESVAVDGIKEGLGRLASPVSGDASPGETSPTVRNTPGKWDRAKKNGKRTLFVIGALFCSLVLCVAGLYLSNPTIRKILWTVGTTSATWVTGDPSSAYNLHDHFPLDKQKSLTVLILGVDHDTIGVRRPGQMAVPQEVANAPGRSDAIMIARFDFDGDAVSSLNVLSIPRDTRVRVPGHGIHKINAAHAYGGPELACATIQDVFGISPDYYVDLNYEGFQKVVDAVGGVDVNIRQPLDYDDNWGKLHIHLKPGQQHLNGYKAMGYVRFRHTDNDLARAQRQHEFLEALRSRVTSPAAFLSLPGVVSAVTDNLQSNMTMDQLLTLANLSRKAPKDAVCLETLPVIQGKTFVYIDKRKSVGVIRKMFFKDKQVADMPIKTPDDDTVSVPRRKRRLRDGAVSEDSRRRVQPSAAPELNGAPIGTEAPTSEPPAAAPDAPEAGRQSVSPEKTEKPSGGDLPKSGRSEPSSGDDSGKASPKAKDGTGTSSGDATPVVRG